MWVAEGLDIDFEYYRKIKKLPKEEQQKIYEYIRVVSSLPFFIKKEDCKTIKVRKEVRHDVYRESLDVYKKKNKSYFADFLDLLDDSSLSYTEQQDAPFKGFEDSDIGIWLNQKCNEAIDESGALEKDNGPWLRPWIEFVQIAICITVVQDRQAKKNRRVSEKQLEMLKKFLKTQKITLLEELKGVRLNQGTEKEKFMSRKAQELFDNPEHDDYSDEDLEYIVEHKKKYEEPEEKDEDDDFDLDLDDDYEE